MRAHDLVSFLLGKDLHEAIRAAVGTGTGVGGEWEASDAVLDSCFLEFLFGLSDRCDFRVRVDDAWDGIVIDMTSKPGNGFDSCNALLFGLVGKHRSVNAIADGVNGWHGGSEMIIDLDASQLVRCDSQVFQSEPVGVWSTTGGDEDDVVGCLLFSTAGGLFGGEKDLAIGLNFALCDLGLEVELEPLLLQRGLELLGQFLIHAWAQTVHEFEDGDIGTQSRPDGSHLQSDDTAADDGHVFWDFGDVQGTGGVDDLATGIVHWDWWERSHFRSGGDQDVLGVQAGGVGGFSCVHGDLHAIGSSERSLALEVVHLVLFEQVLDATSQPLDGLCLCLQHLRDVHADCSVDDDTVIGKVVFGIVEVVG
mmetsp:Transcript_27552/g.77203  ORF Transcript_27552/g.77203 Transcript_27552/m.77203 type:complete len:365 (+) Transcript_27552:278-1372(+)